MGIRSIKIGVLVTVFYLISYAATAEALPNVYDSTYLECGIGDTVLVADKLAVTVTQAERTSYIEFLNSINGADPNEKGIELPQYGLVVHATVENIGRTPLSGADISAVLSPAYFIYPYNAEDEQNPADYMGWISCDMLLPTDRNYKLYGLNTDFDVMKVKTNGYTWDEMTTITDVILQPGEMVEIIDFNGHVNEARHQAFMSPLAYGVTVDGEAEYVCLEELSIDLNAEEYVDCPMNPLDVYMNHILFVSDENIRYAYLNRWAELEGAQCRLEQLRICQELFGLPVTGIVDQETFNHINHYNCNK